MDLPRGAARSASGPGGVRNVVLVGPSGGGKTTLIEALLVAARSVVRPGSVTEGTTVCDFDEVEIRQQRSVGPCGRLAGLRRHQRSASSVPLGAPTSWSELRRSRLQARRLHTVRDRGNEGVDRPTSPVAGNAARSACPAH